MSGRASTFERLVWWLAAAIVGVSVLAVLAFVVATLGQRIPFWGETEVFFEAMRIRARQPLFVDPLVGALDYGPPPARYYVTYPPLLSAVLALVPGPAAMLVGRVAASFAWFGTLAWIALTAVKACRPNALVSAAYIAGIWILANFAMTARPDSFAVAFAGLGLVRAVRLRRIDWLAATCLVLAPWIKPTLLGLPLGAFVTDAWFRRSAKPIALATLLAMAIGGALFVASGGKIFEHVMRANAQPFTLAGWIARTSHHLPFFAPILVLAWWHGRAARKDVGIAIGLGATLGAFAWTLLALAKTGSSANYWMEPAVAALVVIAHAPGKYDFGKSGLRHALLTLAAVLYTDVAAVRSSVERIAMYRHEADVVASLRTRCSAGEGDVIASDEQGIELAANGRILSTAYQLLWLVRADEFPASLYIADVTAPNVTCFVMHSGAIDAAPEVRKAVERRFTPLFEDGAFRVLGRSGANRQAATNAN